MRKTLSILHVDDCPSFSTIVKMFLEDYNLQKIDVQSVGTSAEFLFRANHYKYDAFIVDYQLDILDGLDVLKKVREKDIDTFFILFTGRQKTCLIKKTLEFYKNARYIYKGIDLSAVIAIIITNINSFCNDLRAVATA